MGAGSGWEKGWGAAIFTLPCQGEGRGPKGRGVGLDGERSTNMPYLEVPKAIPSFWSCVLRGVWEVIDGRQVIEGN